MTEPRKLAGRYTIESLIGGGGMATVHRATDTVLDRPVAVKLFRPTGIDPAEQERARREAAVLASLDHPSLVTVYDAGVDGGQPFIVMELVDGTTLARLMSQGQLPMPMVADIGAQVADALDHVHQRGLVHRDVKPANVLVADPADSSPRVLLSDFGIARFADAARLTASGFTIGTAAYMAPEQVRGAPVTPATDVYALGLVLLEALTGHREYPGNDVESAAARLHRSPQIPPTVEPAFAGLLAAMVASDPKQRPISRDVAASLRGLAAAPLAATTVLSTPTAVLPVDEAAAAAPSTPSATPATAAAPARRRLVVLGIAGVLAVVALVAIGVVLLPGGGGQHPTSPPAHTPHTAGNTTPSAPRSTTPSPTTTTHTKPSPPPPPKHGKGHGPKKGKGHGPGHGPKRKP